MRSFITTAQVEIQLPDAVDGYDYEVPSRGAAKIEMGFVNVKLHDIKLLLPDGHEITINCLELCQLKGRMLPVLAEDGNLRWFSLSPAADKAQKVKA